MYFQLPCSLRKLSSPRSLEGTCSCGGGAGVQLYQEVSLYSLGGLKAISKKLTFSPRRPPGQLQARLTQVSYGEFLGAPDCLVKNTVALQEG